MSISASKHSLQIAKRNLSTFYEISVISIRIQMFRRLSAVSTLFYTPHVVHVDFSVENIPVNRKTQSFKFLRNLCYFVPDWDNTAFKRAFHSILHAECSACRLESRNKSCKSQNAIFQISTKSLSFRSGLRYYGHINALSTPFYTANVVHVDLSVETRAANRKTQSFKFLRNLCHSVSDWDTTAFKRSFQSILHAECSACRLERRNRRCKSQTTIIQISTKSLSFRTGLRYYGI
jgi:hypothetical protein